MASTPKDGETAGNAPQMAGSSAFEESNILNEEFVFTDNNGQWDGQAGQDPNNNQDQDEDMADLVSNLDALAPIRMDQPLFTHQVDGNRQATGTSPNPFINYDQPPRMSIAPRDLDINGNGNGDNSNGDNDESYQQFFKEIVDAGIIEDDHATQGQSAFMRFDERADELAFNASETLALPLTSKNVQLPTQVNANAGLEDVFIGDEQFGLIQFQQNLRMNQARTFNLQEPPRAAHTISAQSKSATEDGLIDPQLRFSNTQNMSRPPTIPQASPTGFSAHRRQHVARNGSMKNQTNPQTNPTTNKGVMDERATKRPRVAFGENIIQHSQQGDMGPNQTFPLPKVPEQLILRSDPVDAQGGKIFGPQPQNPKQFTGILRPQPRLANQQIAVPRKSGSEEPGMGNRQVRSNHPQPLQGFEAIHNQFFDPSFPFDAFGPTPTFNPDRLLGGPPSMIDGPPVAPANPSPITPSLKFPFEVFKYPTGEHYVNYLTGPIMKVLYENFYHDVRNFPRSGFGKLPPATLIDVAVHYFKSLNWDNPVQLNMIYFITILHHSQQTELHQWLWELFTAASIILRLYPHRTHVLAPIENIKWNIARLAILLLKNDMTEYNTRESPVFGRKIGPAPWTKQHSGVPVWKALGIQTVVKDPRLWVGKHVEMTTAKFMQSGINLLGSPQPYPEAEDAEGWI